jgi:hypothetical protein
VLAANPAKVWVFLIRCGFPAGVYQDEVDSHGLLISSLSILAVNVPVSTRLGAWGCVPSPWNPDPQSLKPVPSDLRTFSSFTLPPLLACQDYPSNVALPCSLFDTSQSNFNATIAEFRAPERTSGYRMAILKVCHRRGSHRKSQTL